MRNIRYALGDMLGSHAPASMRRSHFSGGWLVGLAGVAAAAAMGYAALRLTERMLAKRDIPHNSTSATKPAKATESSKRTTTKKRTARPTAKAATNGQKTPKKKTSPTAEAGPKH